MTTVKAEYLHGGYIGHVLALKSHPDLVFKIVTIFHEEGFVVVEVANERGNYYTVDLNYEQKVEVEAVA